MIAKKGINEEQIARRFNEFARLYRHKYPESAWEYIEENFWFFLFSNCAPDILMQIYAEIGIEHEDGDFYKEHIKKIKSKFDIGCHIVDIGSGIIPSFANQLAYEQIKAGRGTITIYEPMLLIEHPKHNNMRIHREELTENTSIKEFDLLTGIMPCEATEVAIEQACKYRKNFYIAMCGCTHFKTYIPGMDISPESYQEYVIDTTKKLLKKYDNGTLEIDRLDARFDIDYPILSNKR